MADETYISEAAAMRILCGEGDFAQCQAKIVLMQSRLNEIANYLLTLDNGARHSGNRELWRGVQNAPIELQARYGRICRIISRYRIRGYFNANNI